MFKQLQTDDKIWAKLFGAVDLVSRGVDVFSHFGVVEYLTAYGLVVDPTWRGCSIGKEMLLARYVFYDILLFFDIILK
ncbi:unnamed protein product [Leptosia nina]|uniref:N-acetyltransferase domain-containing protein n=1 Tax=Leptosia nina TaxID=320188 RepID=A0AAV1JAT0_9NEOP